MLVGLLRWEAAEMKEDKLWRLRKEAQEVNCGH
jgi:hypothetical protein